MRSSIIIPTLNCETVLGACLSAIVNSTYKDYEIIVVDGHSTDRTQEIARRYAHQLLIPVLNCGRGEARNQGIKVATGEILIFLDADNVVRTDTLQRIVDFLVQHPEVDAVNGLIAKEHPNPDFFSQYKNLYMHFNFRRLPEEITFLHGSLYALRKESAILCHQPTITDDTARGQTLFLRKKRIRMLQDLEIIHLKKYHFWSFLKNDFVIPYCWSYVFLQHRGWRQLGKRGTGYAHASRAQLASLLLVPTILLASSFAFGHGLSPIIPTILLAGWIVLNSRFHFFLIQERGLAFGCLAVLVTFLDGLVMFLGVFYGLLRWTPKVLRNPQ